MEVKADEIQETTAVPSEQEHAASEQSQEQISADTSSEQEELGIPKKFVGKSPQEIARSYTELERLNSRIASEKSHAEKRAEEMQQRLAALELQAQQAAAQQQSRVTNQPAQVDEDPLSDFDKHWDTDPKEAVKKTTAAIADRALRAARQAELNQRQREAFEYHNQQKSSNADYAALERDMGSLAQRFGHIIKPEYLNSKEILDALYLAAQGSRRGDFEKRAVEAARDKGELVRAEKRKAFSEGTTAEGDSATNFADLSLEDMRKMLGVSDK